MKIRSCVCALLLLLPLCGCVSRVIQPISGPVPPAPTSPAEALRLFEWCYQHKSIGPYRELFTDDFRFFFSPTDSAGAGYRVTPWTRDDEIVYAEHLFALASSISLNLDKNFLVFPDPRCVTTDPRGRWHENIRTQVVLNIRTSDGNAIDISGASTFYFVRGDSALIPEDLRLRGFVADSTRWYINRWDDETAQGGPTPLSSRLGKALPVSSFTWGGVKVMFLSMATSAPSRASFDATRQSRARLLHNPTRPRHSLP